MFDCDGLLMDTEPCWTVAETAISGRRFPPPLESVILAQIRDPRSDGMSAYAHFAHNAFERGEQMSFT